MVFSFLVGFLLVRNRKFIYHLISLNKLFYGNYTILVFEKLKPIMPIPNFDHNFVIPPHLGDPTKLIQVSPYLTTTLELCQVLGYNPERRRILSKFLQFRQRMNDHKITKGFQWLDGSFLENVEITESRSPNDLDVVTFYAIEHQAY